MYQSLETICNRESYKTIDKMNYLQKIKLLKKKVILSTISLDF
jgi:hypothetical protein